MEKHCKLRYLEGFLDARALKTLQKLMRWTDFMAKKCVKYRVFDGKHCKNTIKNNVLEGFLVYMFELASGIGTWKN